MKEWQKLIEEIAIILIGGAFLIVTLLAYEYGVDGLF